MIKKGVMSVLLFALVVIALSKTLGVDGGTLERAASIVAYPFLVVQHILLRPYKEWRVRRRVINNLLQDFEKIVKQRDLLSEKVVELSGYVRHLADTQELRDYLKRFATGRAIHAPILVKNFSGIQFFLVDAGTTSGVKKGMIAVCHSGLIGKVTEAYPSYSKVILITDPSCKVAAFCGASGVKGIHEGNKKGTTTLSFVDHRDEVYAGDWVLSSGEGGLFPRGFGLGKITHVDSSPYGRSIVVKPLVDMKQLAYCTLVPNTITEAT